jgi:hypothetical protein
MVDKVGGEAGAERGRATQQGHQTPELDCRNLLAMKRGNQWHLSELRIAVSLI